jgi:hypothetical protein
MNETTKTLLIVGGIALVGYLLYRKATGQSLIPSKITSQGTGNSVPAQTAGGSQGSANWWNQIGSIATGVNSVVGGVESTYNKVYDYFGGGSTQPPAAG